MVETHLETTSFDAFRQDKLLAEIGALASETSDLDELLRGVVKRLKIVLPVGRFRVLALDESGMSLAVAFQDCDRPGWYETSTIPADTQAAKTHPAATALLGTNRLLSDVGASLAEYPLMGDAAAGGLRTGAWARLVSDSVVFGVIEMMSASGRPYSENELSLLEAVALRIQGRAAAVLMRDFDHRRDDQEEILAKIGRLATFDLETGIFFAGIAEEFSKLVEFDRIAVTAYDSMEDAWTTLLAVGEVWDGKRPGDTRLDREPRASILISDKRPIVEPLSPTTFGDGKPASWPDDTKGSAIHVPLVVGDETIGVLAVRTKKPTAYGEREVDLAVRMAAHITGPIANAGLMTRLDRQAHEESVLAEIGRVITSTTEISEVYRAFGELVNDLIPSDRIVFVELDEDHETASLVHTWGPEPPLDVIPLKGSLIAHVLESDVGRLISDLSENSDLIKVYPGLERVAEIGTRSFLVVPLVSSGKSIGAISIHSYTPGRFTSHHLRLAQRVASQVSGAVANARAHADADRRAREERVVAEIGRVISESADIHDVYQKFGDTLSGLIPADRITFLRPDAETGTYRTLYNWGVEWDGRPVGGTQPLKGSVAEHIMGTGRGHLVSSTDEVDTLLDEFPGLKDVVAGGARSLIGVPLIAGGAVVGTLHIQSRTPGQYSRRDLNLAERIASQVAGAIANAEMHAEADRRARQEAVMAEIGRSISASVSVEDVYDRFGDTASKLISADRITFLRPDEEQGTFRVQYNWGEDLSDRPVGSVHSLEGSLLKDLMETGRGHLIPSADDDPQVLERFPRLKQVIDAGVKSLIGVPLIARGTAVGSLQFQSCTAWKYTGEDLALAERVASQVAGAIANSDLHAETDRRARIEKFVADIGRLITDSVDVEDVYEKFGDAVNQLIPSDRITFLRPDSPSGAFQVLYRWGHVSPTGSLDSTQPMDGSVIAHMLKSGEGLLIRSTDDEPDLLERFPRLAAVVESGIRSIVAVPLIARGETIGTLNLQSREPGRYSKSDLELTGRIASQIAGAIANSELYADADRRAGEEAVMAEIGRLISESMSLDDVYQRFGDAVSKLIPADRIAFVRHNEGERTFQTLYAWGGDMSRRLAGSVHPLEGSLLAHILETGRGQLITSTEDDPEILDRFPRLKEVVASGARSLIGVPLVARGATIGSLHIQSRTPGQYSNVDLRLAERVASQVAGAIANAELHMVADRRAREETVLAEISRIVGSSIGIDEVYDRFADSALQLIDADRIAINTINPDGETYTDRHFWGLDVNGSRLTTGRIAGSATGSVVGSRRPLVIRTADLDTDIFPALSKAVESGVASALVVPLIVQGLVVGTIHFQSTREDHFTEQDGAVGERIAGQIAGAIANSRLHAEAAERANEETVLAEIGRVINSSLDMENIYEKFAELVDRLIPSDRITFLELNQDGSFTRNLSWGIRVEGKVAGQSFGTEGSLAAHSIKERSGQLIASVDDRPDQIRRFFLLLDAIEAGLRSMICVPLISGEKPLGALSIQSVTPDKFGESQLLLAERIAAQISGAIALSELHEEADMRASQEAVLAEIGRIIGSSLDIDEVYDDFVQHATELIPADRVVINTIDPGVGKRTDWYVWGLLVPEARPYSDVLEGSVTGRVMESREPLIIGSFASAIDEFPALEPLVESGIASSLAIPMIARDAVVGTVHFQSTTEDAYRPADVALGQRIATLIAGSIANADLYRSADIQAQERDILAEIGRLFGESLDEDSLYQSLVAPLQQLVPHDRLSISTTEADASIIRTTFVSGVEIVGGGVGDLRTLESVSGTEAVRSQESFIVQDNESVPPSEQDPWLASAGLRSGVLSPIVVRGKAIGVLGIQSMNPDQYSSHDAYVVDRVAQLLAGALDSSRLFRSTRALAHENDVLAGIGRAASSTTDIARIPGLIAADVARLIPTDRLQLVMIDSDRETATVIDAIGVDVAGGGAGSKISLSDWDARTLMETPSASMWKNAAFSQMEVALGAAGAFTAAGLNSVIHIPLAFGNEVIGAISFFSKDAHCFGEREQTTAVRIGQQIQGAVAGAALFARESHLARRQEILARIGRAASSSTDLNEVMDHVVSEASDYLEFDHVRLNLINPDRKTQTIAFASGTQVPGIAKSRTIPVPDQTMHLLDGSGGPMILSGTDYEEMSRQLDQDEREMHAGLRSALVTPLHFNGRLFAGLSFHSYDPQAFTDADADLGLGIAQQIEGSVASSDLFKRADHLATENEALASIGRAATRSTNLSEVFASVSEHLGELIEFDRMSVDIDAEGAPGALTVFESGIRVDARPGGATSESFHPDGWWNQLSEPGRQSKVVTELDLILSSDQGDVQAKALIESGIKSAVVATMAYEGRSVGTISLGSHSADKFQDRDAQILVRAANQVVGSVENVRLLDEARRLADENEALARIGRIASSSAGLQELLDGVMDDVFNFVGYDHLAVFATMNLEDMTRLYVSGIKIPEWPVGDSWNGAHLYFDRDRTPIVMDADEIEQAVGLPREENPILNVGLRSSLYVPLVSRDEVFGLITFESVDDDAYQSNEVRIAGRIADQLGGPIADALLRYELTELNESLERRIDSRTAELQEANADLESFSVSVSHDLRGPLQVASGFSRIVLDEFGDELPEGAARYLELIQTSSIEMESLVDGLLEFSRLGRGAITPVRMSPNDVARDVVEEIQYLNPERDVQVEMTDMPECMADPVLLRQVYMNLLGNAFKFTKSRDEPRIRIGSKETDKGVAYFVEDNGVGFEMRDAEKIFDVFERLHRPETYPGSGAGLAIVKRIVNRHQGEVWCDAEAGVGATFYFTLSADAE